MTTQTETVTVQSTGEYRVTTQRRGQGIDYYLRVTGPDGRTSEQKVYWWYSMTPYQVAEAAVAAHLGQELDPMRRNPTREHRDGGYVVTLD